MDHRAVKGFGDVIIRQVLDGAHHHLRGIFRRTHDVDRIVGKQTAMLGFLQHLLAILALAQVVIAQDQVELVLLQQFDGILAVLCEFDQGRRQRFDHAPQQHAHFLKVINDEDFFSFQAPDRHPITCFILLVCRHLSAGLRVCFSVIWQF